MENNTRLKAILLVIFPLFMGFLIDTLLMANMTKENQLYEILGTLLFTIWSYSGALIFWFCVGWVFGKFKISAIKSFILGNIVWAVFLGIFIWQFMIIDSNAMNLTLALISQHYTLGFIGLSTFIFGIFTNSFNVTTIILASYLLMLVVFSIAFIFSTRSKSLEVEQA